ncbi:MAG TPA: NPCBM/NEW2 domain-containing protein, partial [Chthonomonadaceae bacterium]|nr:NPCBM/NEW2 domain-containing protein [Chthonomonadaceae bacterium]
MIPIRRVAAVMAVGGLLATLIALSRPARAEETVYLSALDLSTVEQGWGKPHADQSVDAHPITLGGKKFAHGLGTHSPGSFILDLNGGSSRFSAWVGIDDEVGKRGSVEFQIVGDGKLLWASGVLRGGDAPKQVSLEVNGIHQLALLVSDAGDGFEYDHADWADAAFTVTGAAPRPVTPMPSNPVIALPAPSAKPKITSATVFGVFPGTPVLYTVTSVGQRPLTFSASHLPRGLKLDADTGQISGVLAQRGEYDVTLSVKNVAGSDTRTLRMVAGDALALTPPLGWNSYDTYGDDVTEAEILANARVFQQTLQPHGWDYVVVDYRWYDPDASTAPNNANARANANLAMDGFGRLEPAPNRFPSATGGKGFKALAESVHRMGMKFGIHIMRGIPRQAVKANLPIEGSSFRCADAANTASTCGWCPDMYGVDASKPAGQAWYDSLLRQYAAWGVDYIKVDDMSSPYSAGEIEAIHKAIAKCGRSIVFSLSPGDTPVEQGKHVETQANLWRISGDFWDDWGAISHQFDLLARWQGYSGPGHWPDADMIPLGHLSFGGRSVGPDRRANLTKDEQMTLISLWALAPSPLMLGMYLPDNDPWTLALLTNDEVLAVNQDSLGKQAQRLASRNAISGVEVWVKE